VASVLRAVLPDGALSTDASIGSITGPLGSPEIQEAARPFAQGEAMPNALPGTKPASRFFGVGWRLTALLAQAAERDGR